MEYNRLKWACRRGMLELDLLLLPFLENRYLKLEASHQLSFQKLLTSEDQDLFAWLMDRIDPSDAELQGIVRLIREHAVNPA